VRWILFWISAVLITLELLQTKLFAFSLEPSLFYVAIAVALLGMGTAASLLSLSRPRTEPAAESARLARLARLGLLGFGAATLVGHAVFARLSDRLGAPGEAAATAATLLALAAPYLCVGLAIAALLSDPTRRVGGSYAANLIGSALGCFGLFVLLRPLGAPVLLAVLAAAGAACAVPLFASARGRIAAGAYAAALLALGLALGPRAFDFRIQPYPGQLAVLRQVLDGVNADPNATITVEDERVYSVWDPMGRIDVTDLVPVARDGGELPPIVPSKWFTQDSTYGSPLVGVGPDGTAGDPVFFRSLYGAGYAVAPASPDVLVIGLGGAPDVQAALRHGAPHVTAVDINASTVAMVRGPFAEFLGDPYGEPARLGVDGARVELFIADGRGFLERDRGPYDVIQLSGVDTKFVLASGNLAVHENYLYTLEAFRRYVQHLTDGGVLAINYGGDLYLQRLAATALEALALEGAAEPALHLALLRQGSMQAADGTVASRVVNLLVKRSPFTPADCDRLRAWIASCNVATGPSGPETGVVLLAYEAIELSMNAGVELLWAPHGASPPHALMDAARAGGLDATLAAAPLDLAPVPDDRPFFFHLFRPGDTLASLRFALLDAVGVAGAPPAVALGADHALLLQAKLAALLALFAVLLILGPLVRLLRAPRSASGPRAGLGETLAWAAYFSALGLGFILVEVSLIQRYVLFLGHQVVAISTVIGGLLVAAGAGSFLSDRLPLAPLRRIGIAVLVIVAAILLQGALLPPLFGAAAGLPLLLRVAVGAAALAPLGIAMGTLFPTGLASVRTRGAGFVAWAIGINGVLSVIGSTISGPIAILYGFRASGAIGAGIYALAFLCAAWSLRAGRRESRAEDGTPAATFTSST
jgi:hypothetical protein